jgi:acyl phosphate:glycerol-3-phosphate acyltransferase
MIGNELLTVLIVVIIGYFLGSIPTAYIATRLKTGKDIRKLGGGNVGGLNTFKAVGHGTAIIVSLIDISKGAAAAAISYWVLNLDKPYVLVAAAACVIGHNWMVWLKFSGGKGTGVIAGALLVIMPVYGYNLQLFLIIATVIVPFLLTRNVALSMGIALVVLPFLFWLGGTHSGMLVVWAIVIAMISGVRFTPTALQALKQNKNIKDYIKGH